MYVCVHVCVCLTHVQTYVRSTAMSLARACHVEQVIVVVVVLVVAAVVVVVMLA
jgi:hypothetical protein